jgi:hypothetical protein
VLARYGVQPQPANFELYIHIGRSVLAGTSVRDVTPFTDARDYLQKVVTAMEATPDVAVDSLKKFRALYDAAHLATQCAVCAKQVI